MEIQGDPLIRRPKISWGMCGIWGGGRSPWITLWVDDKNPELPVGPVGPMFLEAFGMKVVGIGRRLPQK